MTALKFIWKLRGCVGLGCSEPSQPRKETHTQQFSVSSLLQITDALPLWQTIGKHWESLSRGRMSLWPLLNPSVFVDMRADMRYSRPNDQELWGETGRRMRTFEIIRDLLVVFGIALAVWQLYQTQRSLHVAGAALIVGPYFEARTKLVAAGTPNLGNPDDEAIGQYFAVAQIMCDLVDTGVFSKDISRRLENDAEAMRNQPSVQELAAEALRNCLRIPESLQHDSGIIAP